MRQQQSKSMGIKSCRKQNNKWRRNRKTKRLPLTGVKLKSLNRHTTNIQDIKQVLFCFFWYSNRTDVSKHEMIQLKKRQTKLRYKPIIDTFDNMKELFERNEKELNCNKHDDYGKVVTKEDKCSNPNYIMAVENVQCKKLRDNGKNCVSGAELKALISKSIENSVIDAKRGSDEGKDDDNEGISKLKDSSSRHISNTCSIESILDSHGFTMRPQNQTWTVYTLDSVSAQNLTVVGSIPWAWLREEKWRLHTFAKYPHNTAKSAILLAESGFSYIGSGKDSDDTVICFFCRGVKRGWREDESIEETHRALSRDCAMVTGNGGGNIPLIAPDTVSFGGLLAAGQNVIETDCHPSPSQEAGRVGPTRQPHQGAASHGSSNTPKASVQLATQSMMGPPAGATQPQAVGKGTSQGQASNESGPSSILTSSNTVPSFPRAEDISNSEQTSAAQSVGTEQSSQSNARQPQSQTSAESGHTNPQLSGMSSESPSTVPDGGQSRSQANPSSTSITPSVNQSSAPVTGTQSSISTTVSQPSTPASATQSSTTTTATTQPSTTPADQSTAPAGSRNPTYLELGIITERPKRYEYAVRFKRLETFGDWPRDHHLRKEDLADAGFYYAGYGDCARCFYCGGGLRNWEQDDDVWVEHARWFPKCAFIRQRMGHAFIDTVAHLAQTNDKISFQMVVTKMNIDPSAFQIDSKETPLKNDAAVLAVCEIGYQEADVLHAAASLKEAGQILSADLIFTALEEKGAARLPVNINVEANKSSRSVHRDRARDKELLNTLKQTNNDLRLQTLCKICMDKEVAVVFLPCGHLVCCTECASAMKDCPVCRNQVKGIVRAFMG